MTLCCLLLIDHDAAYKINEVSLTHSRTHSLSHTHTNTRDSLQRWHEDACSPYERNEKTGANTHNETETRVLALSRCYTVSFDFTVLSIYVSMLGSDVFLCQVLCLHVPCIRTSCGTVLCFNLQYSIPIKKSSTFIYNLQQKKKIV